MRENVEFLEYITHEAQVRGCLVHHCLDSRSCSGNAGLPDFIICGGYHAEWWEVKPEYGQLRPGQTSWKYKLKGAGQRHRVVYPSDWADIPDWLDALNEDE